MSVGADAKKLLAHAEEVGLDLTKRYQRGWPSMSAVIVDAVLQRRQKYAKVVKPRVERVAAATADKTTDGFITLMSADEFADVLNFNSRSRRIQMETIASTLASEGVQTVDDLRDRLSDDASRGQLRRQLLSIKYVGEKTLDYFDVLVGLDGTAIDVQIRRFAAAAGIDNLGYEHLTSVLSKAASIRDIRKGDLDAAIWQSSQG